MRPSVELVATTSFTATWRSPSSRTSSVGSSTTRYSPAKTRGSCRSSSSGPLDAREPTRPKLIPITGTSLPSRRASVRNIVPSPPSATASSAARGSPSSSSSVTPAASATARTRSTASSTSTRPCVTRAARLTGRDCCVDPLVEVIGKRRVVGLHDVEEELPVALRPGETGVYDAGHACPPVEGRLGDLPHDAGADDGVADDAALAHVGPPGLELRLHEHEGLPAAGGEAERGRQGHTNRDERDVADDQLGRERQLPERARVRPLQDDDARVVAQPGVQLPVADVEGDHPGRPAAEQHVGEPAGRGADVETVAARGI